jgi:Na+/H+-dicarboxylate symporter
MFRKMPFILAVIIAAILLLDPYMPLLLKQFLYSVSMTIKTIIVFLLPFIIFGLLFKAAISLSKGATKVLGLILALVCCSNFCATFLSHYVGEWIYSFDISMITPQQTDGLQALWSFDLPKLIANDKAMFAGIILGILASKLWPKPASRIAMVLDRALNKLLAGFVYFIPLFVAGFIVKLQSDDVVGIIIKDYTAIFAVIALAQFTYIALSYFVLNRFSVIGFMRTVKNMLPAAISGFSTMSSAASMPLTIIGAENNASHKDLVRSVIPATVNIHLIGDCFAIPILAYAVLKSYGVSEPALMHFVIFAFYFVLAKFSVASIPGGGILVMIPILESYLGFDSSMLSLITALYILFDPVITCANVLGNGAFAKMMDRIWVYKKGPILLQTALKSDGN